MVIIKILSKVKHIPDKYAYRIYLLNEESLFFLLLLFYFIPNATTRLYKNYFVLK